MIIRPWFLVDGDHSPSTERAADRSADDGECRVVGR